MDFEHTARTADLIERVSAFMAEHVLPNEGRFEAEVAGAATGDFSWPPLLDELKLKARAAGLWNLFLPDPEHGAGLSNSEYAPLAEIMGQVYWASEAFNCNAPDTGNMEVLHMYGSSEQQRRWLLPLLAGEIRSAFCMTEPDVASSDATNIATSIRRDGDSYVINGRKWWTTNGMHPKLGILIVMGVTNPDGPRHARHGQILVEPQTPGVRIVRHLPVFGYHEAPAGHVEVSFTDVRVPADQLILGEGRGFEIAQGRLGPGRVHHCMRSIGAAERALEQMCRRLLSRQAFGGAIADQSIWQQRVAECRTQIDMCRLLVYRTAWLMDRGGNKAARTEIASIKVAVPRMLQHVVDTAIQAFGGAGVTDDFGLAALYARARTMRLVDGPDEVHNRDIARLEFRKYKPPRSAGS
ncbi:MAG: acyl-CoA dehydrogenase family protein [Proteobacteria bacterium]|nr:acyl-CoA dehydrogenase family protein [Pseudomonadota bacterium]